MMRSIILSCLIGVMGVSLGFKPSVAKSVDATSLTTSSQNNHPRLFFDTSEIPTLQTKAVTTHQEIWDPIQRYATANLGTAPPATAPDGDLTAYRSYGNMLIPFAFACVITEDDEFCNLAKTYLLTYGDWDQWGEDGYRDMGHAHMLLGNALAYDWLYNMLTPAERQTVRQSLADWAHKMYQASSGPTEQAWNNWWRKSYAQNHYWTNNSALGMAGLVLLGEDERAQMWIDQASNQLSRVQYLLEGIEDGSWHESLHYQSYGLTLSLPFMVNLRKIQETNLLPEVYLQNYPYWRLYNHLPDTTQVILAYGDFEWEWGSGYRPQNLLRFIAQEYSNGRAEWLAQELIAADGRHANVWSTPWYVFEFLYYDPAITALPPTELDKARVFTDLEGVIWRTGWENDDLIFGLKTGAYGGRFAFDTFTEEVFPWEQPCSQSDCQLNIGHNHNDANSFYLYRAGHWLAPERVGVNQSATSFHNTLLIDGEGQYMPPEPWRNPEGFVGSDGFLETTADSPNFNYVAADATRRYKQIAGIKDITRHVLFVRPNYFIMLDNLDADTVHDYTWISHFDHSVSVKDNWVQGDAGEGHILGIGVIAPQPFKATDGDDGKPYIHLQPTAPVDDVRFINILFPTTLAAWNVRPSATLLADTGQAIIVSLAMNDGTNQTDEIILTYALPDSDIIVGDYKYDGQVAVVSRKAENTLTKLFTYGGTFLIDQALDKVLVTNLDSYAPFEALYSGSTVVVSGNISTLITLYAPQANNLTINGKSSPFRRSGNYITFGSAIYLPTLMKGTLP